MVRRPSARHPGLRSWEAGYPDARYPGGWYPGEAEYRDRADGYRTRHRRDTTGGAAGNERLTALTLAVLTIHRAGAWTGLFGLEQ